MKTIIHIGQHKTGTTSIQNFLQDNRDDLIQEGLYVPTQIAGFSNPSNFILNIYALNKNRFSSKKEEIIREKGEDHLTTIDSKLKNDIDKIYKDAVSKNCSKVIWSNEGLYLLNSTTEYKKLKSLFTKYSTEIEVVCCFRDTQSYRSSYIKQLNKQNISYSKDIDSYRYIETDSWLFDYKKKKEILSKVFDICSFFPYNPKDNVKEFLKTIRLNYNVTEKYRLNVTSNKPEKFKMLNIKELYRTLVPQYFREIIYKVRHRKPKKHKTKIERSFDFYKKYGALFIHIPKTAGISVHEGLFATDSLGHIPLNKYYKEIGKIKLKSVFKFCFVRNPYDRIFSAYHYLKSGGRGEKNDIEYKKFLDDCVDFNDFIVNYLDKDEILRMDHFKTQSYYLKDLRGKIGVDYIGKFETLEEDFNFLTKKVINVEKQLPKKNQNLNKPNKLINEVNKEIIYKIYKEDFINFNYDK